MWTWLWWCQIRQRQRREGIRSLRSMGRRWCPRKLVRRTGKQPICTLVSPKGIWIVTCCEYEHRPYVCRTTGFYITLTKQLSPTVHLLTSQTHRTIIREGNPSDWVMRLSKQLEGTKANNYQINYFSKNGTFSMLLKPFDLYCLFLEAGNWLEESQYSVKNIGGENTWYRRRGFLTWEGS